MRARKALWRKLTERSGDTLVEALTAILIAALGSALLATMVMSATNIASRKGPFGCLSGRKQSSHCYAERFYRVGQHTGAE